MGFACATSTSIEQIINLIIQQTFEAMGMGEGFTVEEVIAAWHEIGPMLDRADALVEALAQSGGTAPGATPDAAGPSAAPAPPEPPPSQ